MQGISSSNSSRGQRLFNLLPFLLVLIVALVVMHDTLFVLHDRWTRWSEGYSHGYLMVIACGYLVLELMWRAPDIRAHWFWLALLVVPAGLWAFGYAIQVSALEQVALWLFVTLLCFQAVDGKTRLKLLPIFALMTIALPVWEVVLPALRLVTTEVATYVVSLFKIPVYIDGFTFDLPSGTVLIAGSCAGLAYFLMGISLGGLNGLVRGLSLPWLILSVLLLTAMAIVGNWLRVIALIFIAYYSEMSHPLVHEHGYFGWVIFSVLFVIYLWILSYFPLGERLAEHSKSMSRRPLNYMAALVMVLILGFPGWQVWQSANAAASPVPPALNGMQQATAGIYSDTFRPNYVGYDAVYEWQQLIAGRRWEGGVLFYASQIQGKEMVSDVNVIGARPTTLGLLEAQNYVVSAIAVPDDRGSRLVVSAYLIGQQVAVNQLDAKLSQFFEALQGRSSVALWYASSLCELSSCEAELSALQQRPELLSTWIEQALDYTR